MAPDNDTTLHKYIISKLEEMDDIDILYPWQGDKLIDRRPLSKSVSSRETIVVRNNPYTHLDSKKKKATNPLHDVWKYLTSEIERDKEDINHYNDKTNLVFFNEDDGFHKLFIYHAVQPEDAKTMLINLFKTY